VSASVKARAPGAAELSRLLDTFAATGLLLGLTVDEIAASLPPNTPVPTWLPGCRDARRETRAALVAPVLYRLGTVCEEAARWP
jgi:hypothetical protein